MKNEIVNVINSEHHILELISRVSNGYFSTITNESLNLIISDLDEINRATKSFGKKDSQTFSKLTSLTMVASSPYGRLKQCLAIIEKKRSALRDNLFLLQKQRNKSKRLNLEKQMVTKDEFYEINIEKIDIEINEIQCLISDAMLYIEGAIKDLGSYQDAYLQIKENYKIPDDWNESHYEECEVQEHIKLAIQHAVRDKTMTGRINVGTQEYLEQFGIHPIAVDKLISAYLNSEIKSENVNNITSLYTFIDFAANQFKDEYKKCLDRIGLKSLVTTNLLYNGSK